MGQLQGVLRGQRIEMCNLFKLDIVCFVLLETGQKESVNTRNPERFRNPELSESALAQMA